MKKFLILLVVMAAVLLNFSLSFAYWENPSTPQLEWISNALPELWDRSKEEVLRIMDIFPDYVCTDYGDQVSCASIYNRDRTNNFVVFFLDDYETKHDNLWKASFSIDLQSSDQQQDLLTLFWLQGLKPVHTDEEIFQYPAVVPMCFERVPVFRCRILRKTINLKEIRSHTRAGKRPGVFI